MYTGTLISDLVNAVERAEKSALESRSTEEKLAFWYAVSQNELAQFESCMAGAA